MSQKITEISTEEITNLLVKKLEDDTGILSDSIIVPTSCGSISVVIGKKNDHQTFEIEIKRLE